MPAPRAEPFSFFWHDYETFGRVPRSDRPAQFAGVRTDEALDEIEPPVTLYCRPAPDTLPDPEACLLTGITPSVALERGVPEHAFAQTVLDALSKPGTVGLGYNSLRFDDEVTRFLFWRNLIDPYAREWQNACGRWDLLDVVRACYALRPQGLARLIRREQPKLWDFALRLRGKRAVSDEIAGAQMRGEPIMHISGRYAAEHGCIALVWPLAPHPNNKNELIVWDLAHDPSELFGLNAVDIRSRLFTPVDALPAGPSRLPIKTIHLNRSPMVVGNLKTLGDDGAKRWRIDVEQARRHAELAAAKTATMAGIWPDVFARPPLGPRDVDEDLYGGFLNDADRRRLQSCRAMPPGDLGDRTPMFDDDRLDELVFRYRARNFPHALTEPERARWHEHRVAGLVRGEGGARTLSTYVETLDALDALHGGVGVPDAPGADDEASSAAATVRARAILASLRAYGESIAPQTP